MIKHKISIVLTITFSSILLLSIIVLSILQTSTKLNLPNPDEIKVYKMSTSASATYTKGSDDYNKIIELYNESFEKTYMDQLSSNQFLTGDINEDLSASLWSDANTEIGVFIEFKYNSTKKLIITRNGSTRRVDVLSIIFKLSKNDATENVYIYYKIPTTTSTGSDKKEPVTTEPCYPLITQANTFDLYKHVVDAK